MLRRPISRKRRLGQRGSSLLEGRSRPLGFLMMTFGLIEASMAIYAFNTVAYGAGAAARAAALHGNSAPTSLGHCTDVQSFVNNQSPGLIRSRLRITPTWTPDKAIGSVVKVNIHMMSCPWFTWCSENTFTISSTAQMTITQ